MASVWRKIFRQKETSVEVVYPGERSHVSDTQALTLSTVFACVEAISNGIAQLPLEPYRLDAIGRKTRALDHYSYELLCHEPSSDLSRFMLMKLIAVSTLLEGNGFVRIIRGKGGVAKELQYQLPSDITIVTELGDYGERITEYYNARTNTVIPKADMIHIMNFTQNGIRGESTLSYARRTLNLVYSAERQASDYFETGGAVLGVLSTETGRLSKEQRLEIRKQWREATQPIDGARSGVAVLEAGMTYQGVTVKPADAQLLESRQFGIPEVCRFFNVSPVKVHDLSKSSYSTVEATNTAFVVDSLSPWLTKIEQEIRRKLYPREEKRRMLVEFDTSAITKADTATQANMTRALVQTGVMTPNEARARFNLSPIPGGDEVYMQINMGKINEHRE